MNASRWWVGWLVASLIAVAGFLSLPAATAASAVTASVIALLAAVAIMVGIYLHRPPRAVIWYLFAAGQALWALGDIVYEFYRQVLREEPFPSGADPIYLAAYPVLAAGLYVLIRGRTPGRDRAGLLDAGIIATGLGLLTWAFVMRPTVTDASLTTVERVVSLAYPAGDVLLLAMAARLFVTPGARTASYRLLMTAITLVLSADIAFTVIQTMGGKEGPIVEVGWLLSYIAWAAAALHPSMRSLSETAPDRLAGLTRRRLALLTTTTLLAPAILAYQGIFDPERIDWLAASLGAVALFLLVLARMSGLVAQVQNQAAQLDALAHNDALTGVPNRRAWDLELARHLANSRRTGEPVVVALLDLDHFKRFNDQYGHQAGDRLLKEAAAAWRNQLRKNDLLARYGGEEFGLVLPGVSISEVCSLLARMQAATPLGQTFSGGLARWSGDEAPERLVARADEALYQSKRDGRKRFTVHPADRPEAGSDQPQTQRIG